MGISGVITQGFKNGLSSRIKANPGQFVLGLIKIVTSVSLIALAVFVSLNSHIGLYIVIGYIGLKSLQTLAQFAVPLLSTTKQHPANANYKARIISGILDHVKPSRQPLAILMSGASGSGKSTKVMQIIAGRTTELVHLDSDKILEQIPGYQLLLAQKVKDAASRCFHESISIRAEALHRAVSLKKSLILDATGSKLNYYRGIIDYLKRNNYRVKLVRCEITLEETFRRVRKRGEDTGRVVPDDFVSESFEYSKANFEILKPLVDEVEIVDNTRAA